MSKIGVIGLGYVGLPLAVAFARQFPVVGFDVSASRIRELKEGHDLTNETSAEELASLPIVFTSHAGDLSGCDVFIVAVPTPVDESHRPDFSNLQAACELVGKILRPGAVVVFESTVYPGATEEICAPILEMASGMKCGEGFRLGYSPERINPGDKAHKLEQIVKIVSGQDAETAERLSKLYGSIIKAGVFKASSIKVAEAAKVLENTQRDVNIALMNEMSKICDRIGIRSAEVLAAAGTKWNFLKFYPGLVGGHCIGVDPYYLTAKAEQLGYHPEIILSGRRINDSMGEYIAQRVIKLLSLNNRPVRGARIGILGLTFKENVPDLRNSKVGDVCHELREFGVEPIVHDPMAGKADARHEYGIELADLAAFENLDCLIYAVPHRHYVEMGGERIQQMVSPGGALVDVKSMIEPASRRTDINYWSL